MRRAAAIFGVLLLTWGGAPLASDAATVRQTSVAEMIERCALIFEGRAIATGSEASPDTGAIFTWVDFDVIEVLQGSAPGAPIRLYFLGGTVEDRHLEVPGLEVPAVGERGIYFVEDPTRRQIHPLFGWDQGRFRIERDEAGTLRVLSADGEPVTSIDLADGGQGASQEAGISLSDGVAADVSLEPDAPKDRALTLDELKDTLRRRIAGAAQ